MIDKIKPSVNPESFDLSLFLAPHLWIKARDKKVKETLLLRLGKQKLVFIATFAFEAYYAFNFCRTIASTTSVHLGRCGTTHVDGEIDPPVTVLSISAQLRRFAEDHVR